VDLKQLSGTVEQARGLGARGVEISSREVSGHEAVLDAHGRVEHRATASAEVTVRVWREGGKRADRTGSPAKIDALLADALKAAQAAPLDPLEGPIDQHQVLAGGLGVRDRRYAQVTDEQRADVLTEAVRGVRKASAALGVTGFSYRDQEEVRRFVSSRGAANEEWGTSYGARGTATLPDSTGGQALTETVGYRTFASMVALPYGVMLGQRASALLRTPRELPAGPVRVVLSSRAAGRLVGLMGQVFDQDRVQRGAMFLSTAGASLDPRLHLLDNGALTGGLRSRSFDDRGSPPVALTLIRNGELGGYFVNPRNARRDDTRATGHLLGGALVPSNLILKSGTRSVSALLAEHNGTTLEVDAFDPSHIDLVTGEVDAVVNGVVMTSNVAAGAVYGVRLRGHLADVLSRVVEVCSNTDRTEHVDAPALILDGFRLG